MPNPQLGLPNQAHADFINLPRRVPPPTGRSRCSKKIAPPEVRGLNVRTKTLKPNP